MLTGAAASGMSALSGAAFMLAWHAAGVAKRKELIAEYKRMHSDTARPDDGAPAALSSLNDIENWKGGLDRSGLGGASMRRS